MKPVGRITIKHIRELEKAGVDKLEVTKEYLVGKVLAHDIIDESTGEVLVEANSELTDEVIEKIVDAEVKECRVLYTNDLDRGAYVSNTLRIDATRTELEAQVEIYRMMRPGEPPTKDATQALFKNLFLHRRALRSFRSRPHEV